MSKIALTQQLKIARVPFCRITLAIMIHSNKQQKLQGFGQSVAAWLEMLDDGSLTLAPDELWQEIAESDAVLDHRIYLSLDGPSAQRLRAWKEALQDQLGHSVTIAQSVLALSELFIQRSEN